MVLYAFMYVSCMYSVCILYVLCTCLVHVLCVYICVFIYIKGAVSPSAHLVLRIVKFDSVGPTFSSSESKMASSKESEHGLKFDISG